MQPQPDSQPIAGLFTPRLVARLHREGFDGSLRMHAGGATRVIYFRRGDIASAASNADDDRLPNILIREGRLTAPQVDMAKQKQRAGVSLGKTLIELGFLTPSELLAGARRQVRQILAACFALADGTWQSIPGPLGPEVTNLGLPTRRLIFDALMESGDRGAIVREMGSMESVYRPAAGLLESLPAMRLEGSMEEVARMTDGRATLRELSGRTRLDDFTVSRVVLGLEILGLVELESRPEAASAPRSGRLIRVEGPAAEPEPRAVDEDDARGTDETGDAETDRPPAATIEAAPWPRSAEPAPPAPADAHPSPPSWMEAEPAAPSAPTPPAEPAMMRGFGADEAEPPPFPHDELPAFATNGVASPSGWREDPATGERVHAGPIELTFDGPVGPGGQPSAAARRIAITAVVLIVLVGGAAAFFLRRGGSREETPAVAAPETAIADATPATAPTGDRHDATAAPSTGTTATDMAETDGATGRAEASGKPPAATAPEPTRTEPEPAQAEPPPAPVHEQAPPVRAPERDEPARVTAPEPAPRPAAALNLAAGQARLDAGDLPGAEAAFEAAIRTAPAGGVTLQILIACDPSTITKARAATGPAGDLFALPFALKGRACHRLLWGVYPDLQTARSAAPRLPDYFATAGVNPVPIALGRLRPAN